MLILRNMIKTDVESVLELEKQSFTDAWSEKNISDTLAQKQAFIVVAEKAKQIRGYCIVYFAMDEGEIARIAVDENYRCQGVGRKLLDYTEKICAQKRIEKLLLDVRESNQTARRFYLHYGFAEDGVRKNFYEFPKENAILMSKTVSNGNENKD